MLAFSAVSRIAAFIVGISFLYVSLFFTKANDGRVQNWLVDLWVKVESISTGKGSRAVAFFNETATLINRLLDKIFGSKLFSLQFVATSVSLSICSLFLSSALRVGEYMPGRLYYAGLFILSCLITELVIRHPTAKVSVPAVALALSIVVLNDHLWFPVSFVEESPVFSGIALGILLDAVFVAITRMTLRKQEEERDLKKIVGALLLSLAMGIVLLAPSWPYFSARVWVAQKHPMRFILWTIVIGSTTNLFAGLCAFSLLIVSILALAHKLLWGFASKFIHVCYERRVIENRVLLFTVGSALLSYSTNWFSWLRLIPH